ncbi:MAG: iron-containing alcohol dehydrogenase family protein [Clostridiales bacterium]|nr:iron-containing alcohol dehydrogenase family protein [Clostridiales bacterium]
MNFGFFMPTRIFFGKDSMKSNAGELHKLGERCFIVTGRKSGAASGALDDMKKALDSQGIRWKVFDAIDNNPSVENVNDAAALARSWKAEFIAGIGGGSPLDAAKAVAVLSVNDIEPVGLFTNKFLNKPLPLITIPTTAGTGSEVTPYCVLTRKDMQTKMSFGNEFTFPRVSFLDPSYTMSLPYDVTINTAIDAFSHVMEGYLSRKATPVSDALAVEAMGIFGSCLDGLSENSSGIDEGVREKLLYISMLGGMIITHTSTTIIHGMGYSLTYFFDIPHGKANAVFFRDYLKYNYDYASCKIDKMLSLLKCHDIDEFGEKIENMVKNGNLLISNEEIEKFAAITMTMRSTSNNLRNVEEKDLIMLMKRSLDRQAL